MNKNNQSNEISLTDESGEWDPDLGLARAFLVGAGPGNPQLITLRGRDLLARAEVVIYDRLVSPDLLHFCPVACERICVSTLEGTHPEKWPEICRLLVEKALNHRVVVRLKGGDPFLFGRGAEECEALIASGIPFEVVPGVSSGLGGPAWAGIPVTHRQFSSAVAFVTAHELASKESLLRWDALASFPGTLVFFMPLRQIVSLKNQLLTRGKPPDTPVALIEKGTCPEQRVRVTTLAKMEEAAEGLVSPTLVVVGEVVRFRPQLTWSDKRPLSGLNILLTRPDCHVVSTLNSFRQLGALVENEPIVDLEPVGEWSGIDEVLEKAQEYQWMVFTSAMGVHCFFQRNWDKGWDGRRFGSVKFACIGPSTASAFAPFRIRPDLIASQFSSEGLAGELGSLAKGENLLLVRGDRGRDVLGPELKKIARVKELIVYRQIDRERFSETRAKELMARKWRWVVLGSGNIAKGFSGLLRAHQIPGSLFPSFAVISPLTAQALMSEGITPEVIAEEPTMMGIAKAIAHHEKKRAKS